MGGESTVLPQRQGGGPHGLGDPDDETLRKLEKDVLIAKKVRTIARTQKCVDEVQKFEKCCKDASYSMVYKCRTENSNLKDCLEKWFTNEELNLQCKREYLNERSEYRRTGLTQKERAKPSSQNTM